jgi:type IV pilus assembly protein PilA
MAPPPPSPIYTQNARVPNHLVPAILVTIFCCLPLGIVSIVFAARVNSKVAAGDIHGAVADSNRAKIWSLLAFVLGIVPGILILAAIAIPNLLRSRMAANEASSVGSVRTINTAEVTYASAYPKVGFTCRLSDLGGSSADCAGSKQSSKNACLIDNVLSSGHKSGYRFAIVNCEGDGEVLNTFQVTAEPVTPGTTGQRTFCSDQTGVIRYLHSGSGAQCLENGIPLQ